MSGYDSFQVSGSEAELYERYPVRAFFEDWTRDLIRRVDLGPGDDVLDVACGTGVVSRAAAERVVPEGSVTGADLNEPMIAAATALGGPRITWRVADAGQLPLAEDSFDVVVCQQGLQFFPDRPGAASEMHRVLRPTGRVAVSVWREVEENPYFAAAAAGLAEHIGSAGDDFWNAVCGLADPDELGSIYENAGFDDVRVEAAEVVGPPVPAAELVLGNMQGTPLAAAIAELSDEIRGAMVESILARLADHIDADGRVRVLSRANVMTARKGS